MAVKHLLLFFFLGFVFLFVSVQDIEACHRYYVGIYKTNTNNFHGYRYKDNNTGSDTYDILAHPDAVSSWGTRATGVNEDGVVVGAYEDSNGVFHGFKWDGSNYTNIDFSGANYTKAVDINNNGVIVGFYEDSSGDIHGFKKDGSTWTTIDYDENAVMTLVAGISDDGFIVGNYQDSSGDVHGFYEDGSSYNSFDYDANSLETKGRGNNYDIVGEYKDSNGSVHGYEYNGSSFSSIDYPNAIMTVATHNNEDGAICGFYRDSNNVEHGFIFENSSYSNFDFPGTGIILTRIRDISNWIY